MVNQSLKRQRVGQRRRWLAIAAIAAVSTLTVAACSSSSKSNAGGGGATSPAAGGSSAGATTSGGASACMTAAAAFLKPWDTLATTLSPVYTPLSKKPTPGKTIIQPVNGTIPSDNDSFKQLQQAATSIGWTAKSIVFNGTVEDLNAKLMQAISEKPTAIDLSGWPVAAIQAPLAAAKAAGVTVGLNSISDAPTSYPGYASLTNGGPTAKQIGELNAYEFMRSSNCKGSTAIFSLPFPILKVATDSFTATVKANCPDCSVSYNEIQSADIGTPAATNAIVSKLQSSPSTKYVYTIIGNVADGLDTALSQANITGVKIFGQVPDPNSIAALRNGTNAWWINQSSLMNAWTALDGILRVLDTGKVQTDTGGYPLALLTPQNVPGGTANPVVPADYQSEFKKLWLVGS
jgi:ABC-type sugar transport system substrate-binding protein